MNILQLSHYYFPEKISSSHLTDDLENAYIKAGHTITVFAPTPTRGISDDIWEIYKNKLYEERKNGSIKIYRFYMIREGKNPVGRAFRYFCVHWKHYKAAIKQADIDIIIAGSTPPTQGLVCAIVAKKISKKYKKKVPFIYNLQDVFPDSLVGAGMTTENSLVYRIGRRMEDYTYKNADRIIVISNDIKTNIINKGVPAEKVVVVPNWIDSEAVHPVSKKDNYLYEKYGIPKDKFTVVYAGNLGYAQNIEVIIKSAELLKGYIDIQFVIFGKGAQENEYKTMASGLDNIIFFPIQPYSEVSYVYSLGDVSIVPCKKGFGGSAMPSKTWSIMATGTPVLASFDSETEMESIIKTEEVGLFSVADDFRGLADNILKLYADESLKEKLGMNARTYVEKNLNRRVCTQKYIDTIMETV